MVGVKPASGLKIPADGEAPSSLSSLLNAVQYSVLLTREKTTLGILYSAWFALMAV